MDAFVKTHTWDRARKGLSSLDVALKRAFKAEILQVQKRHGATLLLDLKGFYERVTHGSLLDNGGKMRFSLAILHFALLLYENDRVLVSEGMASAPIRAGRGILAGCPFAPAISKLSFEHVLTPIWQSGLVSNMDLYPRLPRSFVLQLPAPKRSFCVLEARFGSSILQLAASF